MPYARLNATRPAAPAQGVITHVAINHHGHVTAIGLDNEALDVNLGQVHPVPAGSIPEIGQPLEGVTVTRNPFTGH